MEPVRKDFILVGQVGAAGIHEVNAGEVALFCNGLGPQVFLDRNRVIGTTLDGGIIDHDHTLLTEYAAYARNDTGAGGFIVVHAVGGELRQFKEGGAGIKQTVDAISRQQFTPGDMSLPGRIVTPFTQSAEGTAKLRDQFAQRLVIPAELVGLGTDLGLDDRHDQAPISRYSSRPISMRRISEVPAPIS